MKTCRWTPRPRDRGTALRGGCGIVGLSSLSPSAGGSRYASARVPQTEHKREGGCGVRSARGQQPAVGGPRPPAVAQGSCVGTQPRPRAAFRLWRLSRLSGGGERSWRSPKQPPRSAPCAAPALRPSVALSCPQRCQASGWGQHPGVGTTVITPLYG